jgi:Ca2+-binding RTX toxin-like protein
MAIITLGAGRQNFVFERDGTSDTITDFRSLYFESTLDESQEVPPNADIAGIDGTGTGTLNFTRSRFEFSIDINGINLAGGAAPDDMTDMHIHGAPVGASGPIVFSFRNDAETVVDPVTGTVTGGWDSAEAVAEDLTLANLTELLAGNTYFNIHTNRDTAGFIRGQILADGPGNDRIDLREMNIGSIETLLDFAGQAAGNAVLRTFFDGDASVLRLEGVRKAALDANHFIFAASAAETIDGTVNADDLFGAGGNDGLLGRGGNDRLFGETGGDAQFGAAGLDQLFGGRGLDILSGGAGGDRFVFNRLGDSGNTAAAVDRIVDFVANQDHIVLSTLDAAAGTAGNQAFTFIGGAAFSAEGQVQVTQSGGNTFVSLNTTGTSGAEMMFRLDGLIAATGADFVL